MKVFTLCHVFHTTLCRICATSHRVQIIPHRLAGGQFGLGFYVTVYVSPSRVLANECLEAWKHLRSLWANSCLLRLGQIRTEFSAGSLVLLQLS